MLCLSCNRIISGFGKNRIWGGGAVAGEREVGEKEQEDLLVYRESR